MMCFLVHRWEKWKDKKDLYDKHGSNKVIQERRCKVCGKIQLRHAII